MSYVGKNIRKIRTVKKLSQAAFAELFGLARPSVGAYEEGRSEPKMETLLQIAQHFGLSVDLLLTKELTINELYRFDIFKPQESAQADAPAPTALADQRPQLTPYVPQARLLEYIVRHHDSAFIDALPPLTFPHQLGPATRAFDLNGPDMAPTLRHQDVLLCCRIDKALPRLHSGRVYALLTQSRLLVRRLQEQLPGQLLRLRADNPDYPPQDFHLPEALEIWEVHGSFSTYLRRPALLEERVALLEQQLTQLQTRFEETPLPAGQP
ncbi:XRE family transcriptional regulator [Hymenobacter psychrophilus]|uniref:Phage repressor protein C, contains Cro/C1-type HTH and peptisase s24 domains n=1 Tax=Hymenobacter psychrophilus TaxID=651662 RepID=A0A1H3AZQ7_9BACT|nr:LexA family transcriptional regulator [Hymenobacter psychrophilus]SDX35206.1 Phage repressor protein C, contains Cro/C1-type HTH and peptisase s24 domains [Hymenobacter psychrophilus]